MIVQNTEFEKIIAKKDVRYYLNDAHLNVEKSRIEMTDGCALVMLSVELHKDDVSGPVTVEVIKAARKVSKIRKNKDKLEIICHNDRLEVPYGPTFTRPPCESNFPDCDRIVEKDEFYDSKIYLNPEYLLLIAKALQGNAKGKGIVIRFNADDPTGSFKIETNGNTEGQTAILMGMRF